MSVSSVAVVTDGFPLQPRSGSQLRTLGILKALRRMIDDVFLISLVSSSPSYGVPGSGVLPLDGFQAIECGGLEKLLFAGLNAVTLGRTPVRRLLPWVRRLDLERTVERFSPDLVLLDSSYLAPLAPGLRRDGRAVVVDCHNHDSELYWEVFEMSAGPRTKLRRYLEFAGYRRIEGALNEMADQVWVPTSREKIGLESAGVRHVSVVPNTLDVAVYNPTPELPHTIGFPGSLWYPPNQEAVGILLERVFPRVCEQVPDAKLVLAGSRPPRWIQKRASSNISVRGDVPDMRPYLGGFSVVAVPLLRGGGTKLKILEAMAMGKLVVTTPKGAEGLEVSDGQDILIRQIEDFPRAIVEAWKDDETKRRVGKRARRLVEEKYSIDVMEDSLKSALDKLGRS